MYKRQFCVQRIKAANIQAKADETPLKDGDIKPACVQSCSAKALVFGDLNDPESRVSKAKAEERNYGVLEDLNTRPRTTYLAAIRNPNPELEPPRPAGRTEQH